METEFSYVDGLAVCALNENLKKQTGVDFIDRLTNLANNEKATELEAKDFIKKNYPTKEHLTPSDKQNCSLLLNFYIYMSEQHDALDSAVSYCCCEQRAVPYDGNGVGLSYLLEDRNPGERSFAMDFFPND